ncbi:hypothetical protein [Paenibacillus sp. Soil766]|uniref:hypothetical protein n=1 Tax=Paenibacillus sp. Soil766 TaxID=1736404 RepID=UPI000A43E9CF|nr:hypothetical protein [Paenibacillus sp. Soil766]
MRNQIQRILCFTLLLIVLAGGGMPGYSVPTVAADSVVAPTTLLDKDFSNAAEGQSASQLGFDYSTLPSGATSSAVVEVEPVTSQKAMHLRVNGAGTSQFLINKTFSESKNGTVSAEITFLQPGTSKAKDQLIYLTNGAGTKSLVIAGLDASKGVVYWPDTAPVDLKTAYQLNTWHTIKVELNTLTKRFNMWFDGTLISARKNTNDAIDVKKISIGTPAGNGELYVRSIKVTHTVPNYLPAKPKIAYWVGRDKSIAMWIEPNAWASKYSIKIKEKAEDPWYTTATYTSIPTSIPPYASPSASKIWDPVTNTAVALTNGKTYIVGVAVITRDETAKIDYEGEISEFTATPYAVTPIETPDTNVIGTVTAYNNYNANRWSINSGLHVGDEPFADRTAVLKITALPETYSNMDWIKTHADTMKYTGSTTGMQIATFPVRDKASVFVAMDQREAPPAWLSSSTGWVDTGDAIQLADTALTYSFKIYEKKFASGETVTMGLNQATDYNAGKNAGYFVMTERVPTGLKADPFVNWTNTSTYTLHGSLEEAGVTLAVYNNQTLVHESVIAQTEFSLDVALTPGVNNIELIARRAGSSYSDHISGVVHLDSDAPDLQMDVPPTTVKDFLFNVQGIVDEESQITIKNNGASVADSVYTSSNTPFIYPVQLAEGLNQIEISAKDAAGNESKKSFEIEYMFWAGKPEFYNLNEIQMTTLVSSTDMIAQKQITNATQISKPITLFVVLLDSNKKMVDFSTLIEELGPGETKTLSTGFLLPTNVSGYSLKAFIWDSLDGMKPLSDESIIQ